jgi:peptidoglycan/LPS O-acetylase OafA/YrhL
MEKSAGHIPTLDGWRAVAILGVMLRHASYYFFSPAGLFPHPKIDACLLRGGSGVDVFFVLSGFLICSRLVHEQQVMGTISLKSFYIRRAFRILPPYLFYLLAVAALSIAGVIAVSKLEFAGCLFFFRNFVTGAASGWYTSHFWTLALEEHFYLFIPWFLFFAGKKRAALWMLVLTLVTTLFCLLNAEGRLLSSILAHRFINADVENRIFELMVGAWLGVMWSNPAFRRRFQKARPILWLMPCVLILVSLARPLVLGLNFLVFSVAVGMLMVLTALNPASFVGRVLEFPVLRWIGRMSYSLYLWQQMFFVLDIAPSVLPLGIFQRWPLAPLMVFGCASISFYFMERPCTRFGRHVSAKLNFGRLGEHQVQAATSG